MAGLDPAIHGLQKEKRTWMRKSSPRMAMFKRGRRKMAEILGLGCTHRPVMLRRDEDWTRMMRTSLDDPDMPAEMKNPANWPLQLREERGRHFSYDDNLLELREFTVTLIN
jgi:hypothetical protein